MKRNIGKRVNESLRQLKEDMQELQRQMTHKSVYAKQHVVVNRRPKHRKRYLEYINY
jgi:phage-related tail protein